jgi:glycosyltransferase involved in cell wall biosynthesis
VLIVVTRAQRRGAELEGLQLGDELRRRGRRCDVVALAPADDASPGLVVDVLGPSVRSLRTLRALRRRARSFDVVIAYGSSTLPATALALLGAGRRFVYRSIGDPTAWAGGRLRRIRTGFLLRRAWRVVALWDDAGAAVQRLYRVRRDRLRVIANGRDVDRFPIVTVEDRRVARLHFGIDEQAEVVGFVGALAPEKRPLLAVEIAAALGSATHLLVAGGGPLAAAMSTECEAALGDRAHLLGVVADVSPVLACCDVVVVPSRTEGMPGVVIEAMLRGVPIVGADVGAIADMVDPSSGVVVPPDAPREVWVAAIRQVIAGSTTVADERRIDGVGRWSLSTVTDHWDSLLDGPA